MKKLKKIFSLFLVLTIGVLGITLSSPEVKAQNSASINVVIDGNNLGSYDVQTGDYIHYLDATAEWGIKRNGSMIHFFEYEGVNFEEFILYADNTALVNVVIDGNNLGSYDVPTGDYIHYLGATAEWGIRRNGSMIHFFEYEGVNFEEFIVYLDFSSLSDNQRPAISGQENFVTNVDDAKPLSFFQAYITAVDETDGVVPVYVITDNYTANKSVLGSHKVVFGAKDNSDNEATLEVYIRVVDITNPIISGNSSVAKIGYKDTWSISNFQTTLTVSDNYDTLTHNDITVKSDGYTSNKTKLGTYNVVYAVQDNSGNEGTFTKQIQVYDNVKPNISGPSTIATSNTTLLTEADIRDQLTASDEIDGNITSKIELVEDNYTGNGNKVGTYTITYRVVDNAGNVGTHEVSITRSDLIPPVFLIEDGVTIKTTPTTPLNFNQIIQILEATGQVTVNSATTFSTIWEDYTGNEEEPGVYTWAVKARSTDGNASDHYMSIMVLDTEDDDGVEVNPDLSALEWIEENPVLFAVSLFAVIAVVGIIFRKKRK